MGRTKGSVSILGIIGIVLAVGIMFTFGAELVPGILGDIFKPGIMSIDGCTALKPEFGRIECEPVTHIEIEDSVEGGPGLYLPCRGETKQCKFYVTYQRDSRFRPLRCSITVSTSKGDTKEIASMQEGSPVYIDAIPVGGWVRVDSVCRLSGNTPIKLSSYYIPYGLNVYDAGGKFRYTTKNCELVSVNDYNKICISDECGVMLDSGANRLQPDDWVNYMSDWNELSGTTKKIVDYENRKVLCQPGLGLYELKTFTLVDGCYKFPDKMIKYVECCPGMSTSTLYCDSFEWKVIQQDDPESQPDCGVDLDCPGQGVWMNDYGTSALDSIKYACRGGTCKIVDRKIVECQPPNIGCNSGEVCDIKTYRCVKSQGPGHFCGDGICHKQQGETRDNCPLDCGGGFQFSFTSLIIAGIVSVLIIMRTGKTKIGMVLAGLVGLLMYYILANYAIWVAIIIIVIIGILIYTGAWQFIFLVLPR